MRLDDGQGADSQPSIFDDDHGALVEVVGDRCEIRSQQSGLGRWTPARHASEDNHRGASGRGLRQQRAEVHVR